MKSDAAPHSGGGGRRRRICDRKRAGKTEGFNGLNVHGRELAESANKLIEWIIGGEIASRRVEKVGGVGSTAPIRQARYAAVERKKCRD